LLAACLTAWSAHAQQPGATVRLVPAAATRWDAGAQVTWLGERRPVESIDWGGDSWIGMASGGGSVGYYWTSHLKTELDVSTSTEGERYSVEVIPFPGGTTPLFVQRDHELRVTTASAGLVGQLFENVWFHPFAGAGIELVREREHIETLPPPVPPRGSAIGAAPPSETHVRYVSRPYVATGFKAYISERAFIRTDIRASWSADGLAALAWRSGVGVDF
jgi:hypothetical protein